MLAHVMRLPSAALEVTRRTTSVSTVMLGEFTARLFPSLAMPVDRVAVEAWALGLGAGTAAVPKPTPSRRARTS